MVEDGRAQVDRKEDNHTITVITVTAEVYLLSHINLRERDDFQRGSFLKALKLHAKKWSIFMGK